MIASEQGLVDICRLLLISGTDISIMDRVSNMSTYVPKLMIIYQYVSSIIELLLILPMINRIQTILPMINRIQTLSS